jgi:hypothetical protein
LGMVKPQEVTIVRPLGLLTYLHNFGSFRYSQKHGSCARRTEQHAAVGFDPSMTASLHTTSCALLQSAAMPACYHGKGQRQGY